MNTSEAAQEIIRLAPNRSGPSWTPFFEYIARREKAYVQLDNVPAHESFDRRRDSYRRDAQFWEKTVSASFSQKAAYFHEDADPALKALATREDVEAALRQQFGNREDTDQENPDRRPGWRWNPGMTEWSKEPVYMQKVSTQ